MEAFWLVWSPAGRMPTFRHESEQAAVKEAERLAALHPSDEFFVLQAMTRSIKRNVDTERLDVIPF